MVEALALEMKVDPIDLRMRSFIAPEQFPYETTTGWTYDSGNYAKTMKVAMDIAGYAELRREQKEKRARGELMGIGISFFTEGVGAGPRKHMDILGLAMNDGADLRVHPSGKAVVSISAQTQGQGHETTFAQIVAEELGIPPEDVEVRHGDTDKSPYGLGTYGSRSTPVSGAAVAVVSRKVRDKARLIAATMLETRPEDLAWEKGRWYVKGDPEKGAMIEDIALRAYSGEAMPEGLEGGLDAQVIYDPPNLTYPYGAYIAVVDVDPDTAQVTVRRFIAVDDCGVRINPMIVDGQIHGGLAEGVGIALMELISFDEEGNCLNSSFMDYLIPTALECPDFELGETVTPCPHHPLGAKGVGESPNVGSPPAIVNAVIDALYETHGVEHIDMPCTPGPRVGGDAGTARAAAMMHRRHLPARAGARRPGRGVRDRHGRARAAADERQARQRRARARRRDDRGLRRRRLHRAQRARVLAAGDGERRGRAAADPPVRRGREAPPAPTSSPSDGPVTVQNPCLSGGAIEVFLEPVLPAPRVLVVGDTPIASAVVRIGAELGLDAVAVDGADLEPRAGDLALVVAAHGRDELHTLRRGARGGAAVRRPGRQSEARHGRARRAARRRRPRRAARADRRARRPRHRRAHARRDRALDPGADRRRAPRRRDHGEPPGAPAGASAGACRPPLAVDPICGMTVAAVATHAVARARRRDDLLLLRGLQGQVRARSTATPASGTDPRAEGHGRGSGRGSRARARHRDARARLAARRLPRRRRASRRRCSWACDCRSRCCSRARPASARPRPPRRWRPCSTRRWCACSATRASTRPRRCTSGTTRASCSASGSPTRAASALTRGGSVRPRLPRSAGRCCRRSSTRARGPRCC